MPGRELIREAMYLGRELIIGAICQGREHIRSTMYQARQHQLCTRGKELTLASSVCCIKFFNSCSEFSECNLSPWPCSSGINNYIWGPGHNKLKDIKLLLKCIWILFM
jgi:hypothetical protein